MKHATLLLFTCLGALSAAAQNTCATALPITVGTFAVTGVNGTQVPLPICAPNGTGATAGEWYSYTAGADLNVTVTTSLPANTGLDTRFHVYTGGCAALACVAGDDDSGSGNLSTASFNVTAGTTYLIAFDNRWSSAAFTFQVSETVPVQDPVTFLPQALPTSGTTMCVVDMNGDHLDDVVSTSTSLIHILQQQALGGFTPQSITTTPADNTASWSLAAGDFDNNGFNDLLYGGGGGVTFMKANADGTAFTEVSYPQYVFSQRSNFVDINNDGNLDGFVCHDVDANVYYLNDGTGNLVYNQGGFGPTCGNYGSIWVDFDGDGDQDLFVAKCGCDPVDILYQNNGNGTFTNIAPALGFADSHQSWSSAWGDYDNDGDMDVLVGSSSSNVHKLMRNDAGTFVNVTIGSGFDLLGGQSIEWTTHDFNNDGWLDILGGGALMLGNGDLTFQQVTITPTNGPIGDLNNDGFLDIMNSATAYMNDGNDNHYLKVFTVGAVSNMNGIGAEVEVTSALGTQIRQVRSGDGFRYMSSLTAHFGIRTDTQVDQVIVRWPSGIVDIIDNPAIDGILVVEEGLSTGVAEASGTNELTLHPVPATDLLYVTTTTGVGNAPVRVLDATGKQVLLRSLVNGQLDVSDLKSGVYLLELTSQGGSLRRAFTKE
ncbi:MAG: VCBS repeat-containing protein [Flavobacteriales bacterium]|jgi:hypothetical protein|nr:VCBS repeat-containing protein [Flavobacteriales bacterium]MBK7751477.1 VCBS repeat-containing protein [Flavobacteriales bacterium]MBK9073819.1 VCBS repeat-containing protein [Flavobacteriales bacterium]MBK9539931.1 VCBS repeat-containing protein [Flavobacteriales bacterium]